MPVCGRILVTAQLTSYKPQTKRAIVRNYVKFRKIEQNTLLQKMDKEIFPVPNQTQAFENSLEEKAF